MDRFEAQQYVKSHHVVDLSSASSGACCVGECERRAFPFGLRDHEGYVDTCAGHASDAIVDALVSGAIVPVEVRS